MEALTGEVTRLDTIEDLKPPLSAEGPCLTVYFSLLNEAGAQSDKRNKALRWKECLQKVRPAAEQQGEAGRGLLESIGTWEMVHDSVDSESPHRKGLVVFGSGEGFHIAGLGHSIPDRAVLGTGFFILPVLAELAIGRVFYLLALAEKNTRLLRCTLESSEQIPLPAGVQSDFNTWMNATRLDHTAANDAVTSGGPGASPSGPGPKVADREKKNQYLLHYFKQIDRGVSEVLRGRSEPLILCAVEYELPLYREVNGYPHLGAGEVRGAPDSLKSGEMHTRATEALERCYEGKAEQALAEWNHKAGGGASSRRREVMAAAQEGRVLTLLISDAVSPADEETLNELAAQTILHSGRIVVVPQQKMPEGSPCGAIFRY